MKNSMEDIVNFCKQYGFIYFPEVRFMEDLQILGILVL